MVVTPSTRVGIGRGNAVEVPGENQGEVPVRERRPRPLNKRPSATFPDGPDRSKEVSAMIDELLD